MQSTKNTELAFVVTGTILRDVADGTLPMGSRVGETAYARKCDVSRNPVRRALEWLDKRSFVEIRPNQGAFIQLRPERAKKILAQKQFQSTTNDKAIEPGFMEVARRVKSLLMVSGGWPDEILKDASVARKFNVSRTTANRALALLAQENVLESIPRRGWRRSYFGVREFLDWYDFRIVLEPSALESAWKHLDQKTVSALLDKTCRATKGANLKKLKASRRVALDTELHQMIQQTCANPFLKRALGQVEAQRLISVSPSWQVPTRARDTFQEHEVVLREILNGNKRKAVAALKIHLINARRHVATMALEMNLERLSSGV